MKNGMAEIDNLPTLQQGRDGSDRVGIATRACGNVIEFVEVR